MKILFLEDEPTIQEVLTEYMKMKDYDVTQVSDGDEAIEMLAKQKFDMAILDIMVPGASGLEVLSYIKNNCPDTATIMLTALEDEKTELQAFNLYTDDYVIKPVSPIILLKRIEAIFRRIKSQKSLADTEKSESADAECKNAENDNVRNAECKNAENDNVRNVECRKADNSNDGNANTHHADRNQSRYTDLGIHSNSEENETGLVLLDESYQAVYNGQNLSLTLTEFLLLQVLKREPHRAFTREQLILQIFNEDYIGNDRVIDAHIKNLRKKLPKNYIKTVIGIGYQFNLEASIIQTN